MPTGWTLYGFAADNVVGVDVVLNGKAQPATMLPNAYLADLGGRKPERRNGALVHYADGTTGKVPNDLRAPGS